MAWTTPRTWVAGETVTAQLMNAHVRDNLNILKTPIDDNGKVQALSSTYLANLDGSNLTNIPKKLNSQYTPVGNVGGGEDDLMSYTLPGGTLATNGNGVRITGWGTCANNGNTKTIKGYWGGGQVSSTFSPAASAAQSWRMVMEIVRSSSTTQKISTTSQSSNTNLTTNGQVSLRMIDGAKTLSADQIIKFTGQATTDNDISQEGLIVELLP